ncbi:hypothetical protein Tco_0183424 [Tanacetum coccineum]
MRPTKGYSGQEVALFPTMLDVTEPSTSPLRITSSPSPSPEPSPSHSPTHSPSPAPSPTPEHITAAPTQPSPTQPSPTQPSPGAEHHLPTPNESPIHAFSAFTKLNSKVKKLEAQIKIRKARRKARIFHLDDEDIADDSSKHGRILSDCRVQEKQVMKPNYTAEVNLSTAGGTITYTRRSAEKRLGLAEAIRLEEQMNEEQRAHIARDEEIAQDRTGNCVLNREISCIIKFSEEKAVPRTTKYWVRSLKTLKDRMVEEMYRLVSKGIVLKELEGNGLYFGEICTVCFEPAEDDEIWKIRHDTM